MKTIEPPARDTKEARQDVNADHESAPPTPHAEAYWTLWRCDDDTEIRRAWDIPPRERPRLPHEGLCACGFDSPAKLLADLLGKGWKKDSFDRTANRFARIETTPAGIVVTSFETYAAACQAHALSTQ